MKLFIDFFGCHLELTGGFAWAFIGLVALIELAICAGIVYLFDKIK